MNIYMNKFTYDYDAEGTSPMLRSACMVTIKTVNTYRAT